MNVPPHHQRVLVVGRSPGVLTATVDVLRAQGYRADATNQPDRVLDDYDVADLDVLVFGGMVPADSKQRLRDDVGARNPRVTVVQGLAGIAGLIAAQVRAATSPAPDAVHDVGYDAAERTVRLTLDEPADVTVEAWWATSLVPPEPRSASAVVLDRRLDAGSHAVPLPDEVPSEASFVGVSVGGGVHVLVVGPLPAAVTGLAPATAADDRLPQVATVTTTGPGGIARPAAPASHAGTPPSPGAPRTLRGQRATNLVVRAVLRTPGLARLVGGRLVTVYVVGRTTGRRYTVPVAYLADGRDLLVGTSFRWARNLRTGEPVEIRLRGRRRRADVAVSIEEDDVVPAYAEMARTNRAFASFNRIHVDERGEPDRHDLVQAWLAGARVVRLTPL